MTPHEERQLRARAHSLKPVVMIAQAGVTPAVLTEIDRALERHELIKVRIRLNDRDQRRTTIDEFCSHTASKCIQSIGKVAIFYRRNADTH
jgi:RNA-binding protein